MLISDTVHNLTYCCKVSPCGRFVATSGFTPDVKVWEVKFSRSGEFEKVARAFDLTGCTCWLVLLCEYVVCRSLQWGLQLLLHS